MVTDDGDGTLVYTTAAGFVGTDHFSYTATDENGGFDTAEVEVTVIPNGPPEAVDDAMYAAKSKATVLPVLLNDSDPDGDPLTITTVTQGTAGGMVTINPDGTVTYTAPRDYLGPDIFTYTISDGVAGSDTATVAVSVVEEGVRPGVHVVHPRSRCAQPHLSGGVHLPPRGLRPDNANPMWFSLLLPDGWVFESATLTQGRCFPIGQVVDCDLGDGHAGDSIVVTVNAIPTTVGTFSIVASSGSPIPRTTTRTTRSQCR